MEYIRDDWKLLKDKVEIDIVEKYANNVRLLTITVIGKQFILYSYIFHIDIHKTIHFILIFFLLMRL